MTKKILYGKSNFEALIQDNGYYVDKTRFIEKLESLGADYLLFLRPRRFGKSLFLSTLEHYYDLNRADQLEELGISSAALARQLQVPTNRVTEILKGRRSITGDTALRLGHFFGTSPEFWMNLQKLYDLRLAESKSGKIIKELPTLVKMTGDEGNGAASFGAL